MAQGTLLLTVPNVSAYQLSSTDKQPCLLVSDALLSLHLLDIPSTTLKSFPSSSLPPSYSDPPSLPTPSTPILDTWLVLSLADGLIDIPLAPYSPLSFEPPCSYLIPVLPADASLDEIEKKTPDGIVRIDLSPALDPDTLDTLDSIFAGWTAYPGRLHAAAPPAHPKAGLPPLPDRKTGPIVQSSSQGRLALMDESTGEICGELTSDISVHGLAAGKHAPPYPSPLVAGPQPVLVSLSQQPNGAATADVRPLSPGSQSRILSGAEWVSRGIIAGSEIVSALIAKGGSSYLASAKPAETPITFSPSTHATTERVLGFTQTATKISAKGAWVVGSIAGRVGDRIGKSAGIQRGPRGEAPTGVRGHVHKGVLAINAVLDSIEVGGKKVLTTAGDTTTTVVRHAYGPEAGKIAERATGSVQNVALVYIDARGVTRKAVLKAAGKAAVRGRMHDGREVVFGSDESVDSWTMVDERVDESASGIGGESGSGGQPSCPNGGVEQNYKHPKMKN